MPEESGSDERREDAPKREDSKRGRGNGERSRERARGERGKIRGRKAEEPREGKKPRQKAGSPEAARSAKRGRERGPTRKRRPQRRRRPEPIVRREAGEPGPARLYALLAGAGLTLLGIVGFFFDAGFATGSALDGDDIAGILIVNGWRNSIYLLSGLLALALAASRPRAVTLGLGVLYLALGIAGATSTSADIGSLFDALPLTDEDNLLHIAIGGLGLAALWADGALSRPLLPKRKAPAKRAG